ncbi:uncharacterized protein LOC131242674 [Magnolia sinica]|uniref:uncharacterized protein LOC131242674 n=1 Tax=Magnolia sinica TaxID=86752 RepID=UPI00265984A4|nr:uncharacterized protein LOC131242674 [Magnolia sinica]
MDGDDSFKRPGSVPFKWEIQPGIPKEAHQNPISHQKPHKLRPPPAGISFYPPDQGSLFIRVPARSKSSERRRPRKSGPINSPSIVSVGCFPTSSPIRKFEKKTTCRETTDRVIGEIDVSNLQTLSRWTSSPRKSLSLFHGSPSPATSFRSPPATSFRSPPLRAPRDDVEWAAYGLF